MALLNYTTNVPAKKTQEEIISRLVSAGADRISFARENNAIIGISFEADTPRGPMEFQLPARVEAVQATLRREQKSSSRVSIGQTSREHAERVAWRIVWDWLRVQLALIESGQAEFAEVMLPYMLVQTSNGMWPLYESFRHDRALLSGAVDAS